MKLVLATAVIASSVAMTGTAVAGSAAPPCTPKITKIGGKPAVVNCGPATATVKIGGRTYNFKDGFYERSPANKEALNLTLGTAVETAKPGSAPYFDITVSTPVIAAVNADYGGKTIVLDSIVSVKGKIPSNGTFAQTILGGGGTPQFTGTWNCHGVIYTQPG
jgi:hypothetical protein